jgi:rod shape-determining protein MreC
MSGKFVSKKIFKVMVICFLAIFLIIFNPNNLFDGVRKFFMVLTAPVQKVFSVSAIKVASFGEAITSIGKIRKENKYLIEDNLRLRAESTRSQEIMQENEVLRNQLNILPRDKFEIESANVIGRDIYNDNDWILIDKGEKNGLKKGMSVIVSEGVLVGRVEEVFESSAKVIFISNPLINTNVEAVETGAVGLVKGNYGLGLIMDLVLQTDSLKVGDKIITSDISQNIPRGLLVGEIKEISPARNDLFQKAIISSPVDFLKLRFVFIIKNS